MQEVFKTYFRHKSIIIYYLIAISLCAYLIKSGALVKYFYTFIALILAPIFEWIVHKYFLHINFKFKNKYLKNFFYKVHEGHHEYPSDKELVFAPFIIGISVPLIFLGIGFGITKNIELSLTLAFYSLCYYCYYEWIHLAHHTESYIPITKRGKILKKHHTYHHFKNENYWWGVTTILGDIILKTNPKQNKIKRSGNTKNIFQI